MGLLAILFLFVIAVSAVITVLFLFFSPYLIAYFLGRKTRNIAAQKDSQGRPVQLTGAGRAGFGNLPVGLSFVAGLGNDGQAALSAGELILRPTWGLRVISFLLSALLIYMAYVGWGELVPASPYTWPVMAVVLGYAVLATNIYELRYDHDGFVTSGFARTQKRVMWKDLALITDNGHYLYTFKTFDGQKVEVQKYLVGIRDFLTYARDQMDYHNRR